MSSLPDAYDESSISFPPPPPDLAWDWQCASSEDVSAEELALELDPFNDSDQSLDIDINIVNFNLFSISHSNWHSHSSQESIFSENTSLQLQNTSLPIRTLAITQFSNLKYNNHNIGVLVAGFMAVQSRTYSMYIPCDIHSIVFQFYYEEENEVLHFSEKVFRALMTNSSSPSLGEFTGQQLTKAVEQCLRNEAIRGNIDDETCAMSHKLLRLKYIEMVTYVSSFSSLFSVNLLQMDDDFDEKHRYKFAAHRIDEYLRFASSREAKVNDR